MTSDRPYRRGRSETGAVEEVERHADTQFDQGCVGALRRVLQDPAMGGRSVHGEHPLLAVAAS